MAQSVDRDAPPVHRDEDARGTMMVAITNLFNRLNTTLRVPAGTTWD